MIKYIPVILMGILLVSCGKKTVPAKTEEPAKPAVVKPIKTPVPKVITVNDNAARKSAEGRLYYDLEGKRYWKNKKDGKYYLYHKGMFENKDFQKR
ncbi:MAG: hypothetical protein ABS68_09950 [Niastella sp. SCN 39-18]|nr:hypothetical protein [Sphingobacteriales bacterium]ODT52024.1 MAG: hypothetical protein ABS68_09950 [Niastella sp. SCN 39-18]OJW10985.1 MAG: hypothetical protein BGO53_01300 [Sphingobacteriales bacterium 39-19]